MWWVSLVSSLGGAFLGVVLWPLIRQWWFRPRICVASHDEILHEQGVLYHRLAITNGGRLELGSCAAYITIRDIGHDDIAVTARKQLISPDSFKHGAEMENEPLPWDTPRSGSTFQTLNPKTTAKLNLYRVLLSNDGKPDLIQFPSEQGWEPLKISLRLRSTSYNGTVVISAANVGARKLQFQLVADNNDVRFIF